MPTSGLVITLSSDVNLADHAIAILRTRSEFTPGERHDRWLPVAMEARDDAGSRDLHDWLHALPGVEFVDVVYVNFDGDESPPVAADATKLSNPSTALNEGQSLLTSAATTNQGEP